MRSPVPQVVFSLLVMVGLGCAPTRTITITTTPPDTQIFIDDANQGYAGSKGVTAQLAFRSPTESYNIRASRLGYRDYTDVITLENADSKRLLHIDMKKQSRTVNFTIKPPATLLVDGKPVTDKPVSFWSMPLEFTIDAQKNWNTHTASAERPNFQSAHAKIGWSDDPNITFELQPMRKDVTITSTPSGAQVLI